MTQNQKDEQFVRLVDALLAPVRNYKGDELAATVTAAFDALDLLDSMSLKQIDRCYGILLAAADCLVTFGQKLSFSVGDPVRDILINNAVNLVLLVMESFERQGDNESADKAFDIAFKHVEKLACRGEKFPQERRILSDLTRQGRGMKTRLANLQKGRLRLIELHRERLELSESVERHLSTAQHILDRAEHLRRVALCLFELDLGDRVLRLRDRTPEGLRTAAGAILYGRTLIQEILAMTPTEGVVNRAARAIMVSSLVFAHVQATLANVYVEYARGAKAFDDFEVLAHQAQAYAEAATGLNWTFYAPLVQICREEPLSARSEQALQCLIKYGKAALSYAFCLTAQIDVTPSRMQPSLGRPEEVVKTAQTAIEPMIWPDCNAVNEKAKGVTQLEIVESHISRTGEDLHMMSISGSGGRTVFYPKVRLVGFERSRGGKAHRKNGV